LAELGLAYDIEPLRTRTADMDRQDFVSLNASRKIPFLQDGDVSIGESIAIVTYLGDQYREQAQEKGICLLPQAVAERAAYFEWSMFIGMELDATSLYVIRRHQGLPHIYGASPEAVAAATEYFDRMIQVAETKMIAGKPYLLGNEFSGIDILMTACLDWAARLQLRIPPNLSAYRARQIQRKAYLQAKEINQL